MTDQDLAHRKQLLRTAARGRRRDLDPAAREAAAGRLARRFVEALPAMCPGPGPQVVAAYWPHGSEIDTRPLLATLHAMGHLCCLPVVVARAAPLAFRRWVPGAALRPGALDIPVPVDGAQVTPRVIAAPLLAFDEDGYRLGQGGGFYDRTIADLRAAGDLVVAGVAFEAQRVDAVPRDGHDQRLDWLITDAATRILRDS
ncbi:MAG: 5-formyltetrahydrofolate cyclo-ligase [Hyphomicrobiales bacterium]|nr:5-formyltetrahydrofolate cyclo-ligase [Hyphomicrobiales bacterium]MCP5371672.1 5-formyltetrahydrofolate cyclo-ligase [Hyphomicrobiales bacterium]